MGGGSECVCLVVPCRRSKLYICCERRAVFVLLRQITNHQRRLLYSFRLYLAEASSHHLAHQKVMLEELSTIIGFGLT